MPGYASMHRPSIPKLRTTRSNSNSIRAKNLNDEAYGGLTAQTLPLTGMDAYVLAPPRTFGATLRYDF